MTCLLHIEILFLDFNDFVFKWLQVKRKRVNLLPVANLEHSEHLADIERESQGAEVSEYFAHAGHFLDELFFERLEPEVRDGLALGKQVFDVVEVLVSHPHLC